MSVNVYVGVMHGYLSSLVGETSPGLALALVALLSAQPPYLVLCRTRRGRARGAIGYLLGLSAGLAATVILAGTLSSHANADAIAFAGVLASFFAPFAGMLRAKWNAGRRPPNRRRPMATSLSS